MSLTPWPNRWRHDYTTKSSVRNLGVPQAGSLAPHQSAAGHRLALSRARHDVRQLARAGALGDDLDFISQSQVSGLERDVIHRRDRDQLIAFDQRRLLAQLKLNALAAGGLDAEPLAAQSDDATADDKTVGAANDARRKLAFERARSGRLMTGGGVTFTLTGSVIASLRRRRHAEQDDEGQQRHKRRNHTYHTGSSHLIPPAQSARAAALSA